MQLEHTPILQPGPIWGDDAARFYLYDINQSDYAERVGGLLHGLLAPLCNRRIVQSVPAQRGPRYACLSGALPNALHGEDETPALGLILERLPSSLQPQTVHVTDWTFSYRFADFNAADLWFQQRFNPASLASTCAALRAHLEQVAVSEGRAVTIQAPKRSACLVWDFQ
jgi:hypothetical protein